MCLCIDEGSFCSDREDLWAAYLFLGNHTNATRKKQGAKRFLFFYETVDVPDESRDLKHVINTVIYDKQVRKFLDLLLEFAGGFMLRHPMDGEPRVFVPRFLFFIGDMVEQYILAATSQNYGVKCYEVVRNVRADEDERAQARDGIVDVMAIIAEGMKAGPRKVCSCRVCMFRITRVCLAPSAQQGVQKIVRNCMSFMARTKKRLPGGSWKMRPKHTTRMGTSSLWTISPQTRSTIP